MFEAQTESWSFLTGEMQRFYLCDEVRALLLLEMAALILFI
jgi:hypothetical protein